MFIRASRMLSRRPRVFIWYGFDRKSFPEGRKSLRECSSGHRECCPGDRACSSGDDSDRPSVPERRKRRPRASQMSFLSQTLSRIDWWAPWLTDSRDLIEDALVGRLELLGRGARHGLGELAQFEQRGDCPPVAVFPEREDLRAVVVGRLEVAALHQGGRNHHGRGYGAIRHQSSNARSVCAAFCVQYLRIADRGSFTTRVFASKIIVARVAASYAGQCGMCSLSGLPFFASAIHADARRAHIVRPFLCPAPPIALRYRLNDASTSWPCTAPNLPSNAGVGHSQMYMEAGAPPAAALRSACCTARTRFALSVKICACTRYGVLPAAT